MAETAQVRMLLVLLALFLAEPAAQEAGEGAARGVKDEPEQKHIRFVFPQPWLVVRELGDGLRIRVDASDFLSVWLGSGCSLSLLANGQATETERINASFHIEEGLSFGPHKLGAMVTTYDGDVLAIATVIFLYAPGELGQHVPVPTPVTLPRRVPHGAQEGSRGACKPNRRMVRALLQNSGIDCANRAQLVRGHGTDGVVIDVGSHDGHELNALSAVARKVIAFEATPHKAAAIEKLLKEQGIWHKVVLHAAAACNTSGELPLHVPHGEGGSEMDSLGSTFYYTGQQKTINVKSVRIDDVVHEPAVLLKVDTQGHELQVLMGAERLLSQYGVDLIVLEFAPKLLMANGVDPAILLHYLYDLGYTCLTCPGDDNQQLPPTAKWYRTLDLFDLGFLPNLMADGTVPKYDPGRFCDLICL